MLGFIEVRPVPGVNAVLMEQPTLLFAKLVFLPENEESSFLNLG
jgi:hypothetical protein